MSDNIATLIFCIGVLVAVTNIIVEVLKKDTRDTLPTNILAVIVAIVLTAVAFLAWASYTNFIVEWYHIAAVIVVGFLVAYAAMFGFDKLKEVLVQLYGKEP